MRRGVLAALMTCSATLIGTGAAAQTPPAQPPPGGTGDQDAAACKVGADLLK